METGFEGFLSKMREIFPSAESAGDILFAAAAAKTDADIFKRELKTSEQAVASLQGRLEDCSAVARFMELHLHDADDESIAVIMLEVLNRAIKGVKR